MEVEVCDCFVYLRIDAPRIDETQTACSSFFALEGREKESQPKALLESEARERGMGGAAVEAPFLETDILSVHLQRGETCGS